MLFTLTSLVDFLGMGISLWLALYLLGRSFPSRVTLRGVVVLLALAVFFLSAYINLYQQTPGTAAVRAILLTIGLSAWHDLTHKLLPIAYQRSHNWRVGAIYVFGLITVILLLGTQDAFVGEVGNVLWVARMGIAPPFIIYGIYQLTVIAAILYNFREGAKVGAGSQNRYFLWASFLAVSTVVYGVLALAVAPPLPRLIQDLLILSSIALLGFSVARHQTFVERRATLHDFPVSAIAVFCLSAIYAFLAWQFEFSQISIILVTALAILTHSVYNLVREFLDRLRSKGENSFRRQLRGLKDDAVKSASLQERLQDGLARLCQILGSHEGFIAVQEDGRYIILVSHNSMLVGRVLPLIDIGSEGLFQPSEELSDQIAWIAPAFESGVFSAMIGIGFPINHIDYSSDDLDLLAEAADRIGTMVYHYRHPALEGIGPQVTMQGKELEEKSDELLATLDTNPDSGFVKMVEDGLRNLFDFTTLGQSPLIEHLHASGETHIEKGKVVQQKLVHAIETLKPVGERPKEPIPREWYSYVILHDAYWDGIPNRDIMLKLYISEGTFNRTRRAAIRSVARALMERQSSSI